MTELAVPTDTFDVVIVGAGPGGSNAAAVALHAGLRVAQVEAARFPRVKPCAGGLTMKALGALRLALDPSLLRGPARAATHPRGSRAFQAIEFNVWGGANARRTRFTHPDPLLHVVYRPEFDDALVRQNMAHDGFTFIDDCPVTDVRYEPPASARARRDPREGCFHVVTERGTLRGRQLIGADGAYSLVNRIFQISPSRRMATAIEVNLPRVAGAAATAREAHEIRAAYADRAGRPGYGGARRDRDVAHIDLHDAVPRFDYGAVDRGYGWMFPKDDHDCVGLYTLAETTRDMRARLLAYIHATVPATRGRPAGDLLADLHAFRIPIGGHRLQTPACPVYLVGDAGGFADALTGEGIYAALESGRLAGEAAIDVAHGRASHRAYYRRLWRSVLMDTAASYAAAYACYRHVDRAIGFLEHPLVWRPLIEGTARGATFCGSVLKSGWYLPRTWTRGSTARRIGGRIRGRAPLPHTRLDEGLAVDALSRVASLEHSALSRSPRALKLDRAL